MKTQQNQSSRGQWLAAQVNRVAGAFSNFDKAERGIEYTNGFRRMEEEFGRERTEKALTAAIDVSPDWPPTVGKIRELVPPRGGERISCPLCMDLSGFVYTTIEKNGRSYRAVRRCDHRQQA